MTTRVQVILEEAEKESFQRRAEEQGVSLSAWLRDAGRERLHEAESLRMLRTSEDLAAFFAACDARESATPEKEPDWDEHLAVIEASRRTGFAPT